MKRLKFVFVVLLLFLLACSGTKDNEIKVGVVGPYTGPTAFFGEFMRNSFEVAIAQINSIGGVNGKKIKLIYEDDKCIDNIATLSALKKLKEVDEVKAILGPFCGGPSKLAGQFSTDSNIFIISPGDNFGKSGKFMINTRYLLAKEARLLMEYAKAHNWKNIGVLYYNNEWGLGYKEAIEEYLEKNDGKLVIAETYDYSGLDLRTQLLKLKNANVDAIFVTEVPGGTLFKQARELELKKPILSEWEIETYKGSGYDTGAIADGVVYSYPITGTTNFHERFKSKYGKEPNVINMDSYDAATILIKALENCENKNYDAQCMTDYVTNLKDYEGAGGKLTFDKETWSFDKPFQLKQVKNGEFVVLE